MSMKKRAFSVLSVFACLLAVQACAANKYRLELESKGIPYTTDSFFKALSTDNDDRTQLFVLAGFNVNTCRETSGDNETSMHIAVMNQDMKMASFLLDHGYDLSKEKCAIKTPPLHLAAMRGLVDMAKLLIERGADVNRKDGSGMTPLMLARQMRKPVMESFLRREGAK